MTDINTLYLDHVKIRSLYLGASSSCPCSMRTWKNVVLEQAWKTHVRHAYVSTAWTTRPPAYVEDSLGLTIYM